MPDLEKDIYEVYKEDAIKHCDFLCEKIFKPAFVMAFMHGAKHMKDDIESGKVKVASDSRIAVDRNQAELLAGMDRMRQQNREDGQL